MLILALVALAAIGLSAGASASPDAKRGADVTIKMKLKRGFPVFKGPQSVFVGQNITVLNKTSPSAIGPHTFSLVKKSELPNTERERTKCGKTANRKLICKDIAEAHEMIGSLSAGEQVVDNGTGGQWDSSFDGDAFGDSWFTETQFENHTRSVPAEPQTLRFMCIIHPRMQGKIKVVE
jgi:hypothetical protein